MATLEFWNGSISVAAATDDPSLDRWLTPAERRTGAAIRDPHRLSDWRAGRIAAKQAAATLAGIDELDRIELSPVQQSAPRLVFRDGAAESRCSSCKVSIAHRDGHAAAAVSRNGVRVGVDLERERAVGVDLEHFFLNPEEREFPADWDRTKLWTLKEAAWKALSCDASVPFTSLVLRFDQEQALHALSFYGANVRAAATLTQPWPGYVLAVVWTLAGGCE